MKDKFKIKNSYQIDKNIPIPLYYQIERILREKIHSHEIKPGEKLPTEKELEEAFGVSRVTVRRAITNIVRDGLIEIKRGHGTFLRTENFEEPVSGLRSYTEEALKQGYQPSLKMLTFKKIKPNDEILKKLMLNKDDYIFIIVRLRLLNNEPSGIDTTYIPVKLVPKLSKSDFKEYAKEQSLYYILENKYKLILNEAEEIIDATLTNKEESILLSLDNNSPINLRKRVVFLPDNTPLLYMKSIYKTRYKIKLKGRH